MMKNEIKKIAIIGNSGGGKTQLTRKLAAKLNLPVTHVDSIQFVNKYNNQNSQEGQFNFSIHDNPTAPTQLKPITPQIRPFNESIKILEEIQNRTEWIIDGYGPLDILEKRLALADQIIFIDLPIWRHYWWSVKRQIENLLSKRGSRIELPDGTTELTLEHTKKLFKSLWQVHTKMRPEMLKILGRNNLKNKVVFIRTVNQLQNAADI